MTTAGLHETPLHALHLELGGRMVEFAGYAMPVQYPTGILSEHQHTRAFTQYKAIATSIEWPRRALRLGIARRKRTNSTKASKRELANRRFGATRQHGRCLAPAQHLGGFANRLTAGRTGGGNGGIVAQQPKMNSDLARWHIW